MRPQLPKAVRISSALPSTEIIYDCPRCGTSFQTLGHKIKFCYNCGIPIDWEHSATHLRKPLAKLKSEIDSTLSEKDFEDFVVDMVNKQNAMAVVLQSINDNNV